MSLTLKERLFLYCKLMRFNRPIGTFLLLWPTLWALWLAADGLPNYDVLLIFILGVTLMRAAGCVINDYADREFDGHVARTKDRPLVNGQVTIKEAFLLIAILTFASFILVLFTNPLTIWLSLGALLLAFCYPFMKRYTHMPQLVLGAAFSWSIPMAFAAQLGDVPPQSWLIFVAAVLWTVVYDTLYAMVDREDDLKIGIKSTAILFGEQDRAIIALLQGMTLFALIIVGQRFGLGFYFYTSLGISALLFFYQQHLIRYRHREECFKAFLNNNWVGLTIFIGIAADKSF